jgi:hypothetical protein
MEPLGDEGEYMLPDYQRKIHTTIMIPKRLKIVYEILYRGV